MRASQGGRLAQHRNAMKLGQQTMLMLGVPQKLREKVQDYYDYAWFRAPLQQRASSPRLQLLQIALPLLHMHSGSLTAARAP